MKKTLIALSIGILSLTGIQAQQQSCGFDIVHQQSLNEVPQLAEVFQANEQEIQRIIAKRKTSRRAEDVYTIPVVVHVIHKGEAIGVGSNISDAQINSGITQMNDAFRNTSGLSVDTKVQFQLALKDENCSTTNGINRVDASGVGDYATMGLEKSTTNGESEATIKALSRWSSSSYYNIWIITEMDDSNAGEGGGSFTAGYAYFPGASSAVDGTIILHSTFGNVGTAAGGTSGTLIHELGHALNLYHVFEGDNSGTACPGAGNLCGSGVGDCCGDTSPYKRTLFTCPTGTESCSGAAYDNTIKNYMDYSSDACTVMYTENQKSRMRAALEGPRGSLLLSNALTSAMPAFSVTAATCTGTTTSAHSGAGVRNVQIKGKLNVSSGSALTDGGYFNNATSCAGAAILELSTQYEFHVSVQTVNRHQVKAWIDYNDDGDFTDAGEEIFSISDIDGSVYEKDSVNFTVPGTATTSKYLRMRVLTDFATAYGNPALTTACATVTNGETEDYLIYINSGTTAAPVADFTVNTTTACIGDSIQFSDASTNTPTSWSWTTTGASLTSGTDQYHTVVYNTAGTYSVSLTASNAGGNDTETKTSYITVSDLPVVTVNNETICAGDPSAFMSATSSSTIDTYLWSGLGVGNNYGTFGNISGDYTVTVTTSAGCVGTGTGVLTTKALPVVYVGDSTICEGGQEAMFYANSDTAANSYVWSANGTGTQHYTQGTVAGDYVVTVTDVNGCTGTGIGVLTVRRLPVVRVNDESMCTGDVAATFTAVADSLISYYEWSHNGTGYLSTTTGTTAGDYTVTVYDYWGCMARDTAILTVNPLPIISVDTWFPLDYDISIGDVTLTFGQPVGGTYSGTGVTNGIFNTASAGNGLHSISYAYTDGNGCGADVITVITVSTSTSVLGASEQGVAVSPNPFHNQLAIKTAGVATSTYALSDESGKVVLTGSVNSESKTINTESIAPGMYYLSVNTGGSVAVYKVVKSH
ncbi:MAG: PKD repeat protein [Glaciecola sp.]|jgi:PKD repeat protein